MPDKLETLLRAERDRLDIHQPPLSAITRRASTLRRRRRAAQSGVLVAIALAVGVTLTTARNPDPPQVAAPTDPAAVWSADGVTINGLPHLPVDLPGTVRDVEFLDPDRGFVLTVNCENPSSCTSWVGGTTDGGRTWRTQATPGPLGSAPAAALPQLLVTGEQITLLSAPQDSVVRRASSTDGATWTTAEGTVPTGDGTAALPGDARLVQLGADCGSRVGALLPLRDGGGLGLVTPPRQPSLEVCWVSPVRAGDGSWWVGGRRDGHPAVAVSRDGGQHWATTEFGGTGRARVAMLGHEVYAVLVDPVTNPEQLLGVATSHDGGASFGAVRPASHTSIGGDLAPLLDGRLLIVDGAGHWLVSADQGGTWHRVDRLHPTARLARTAAGYVAYEMSTIYTAFSVDGSTWQKLDAQ